MVHASFFSFVSVVEFFFLKQRVYQLPAFFSFIILFCFILSLLLLTTLIVVAFCLLFLDHSNWFGTMVVFLCVLFCLIIFCITGIFVASEQKKNKNDFFSPPINLFFLVEMSSRVSQRYFSGNQLAVSFCSSFFFVRCLGLCFRL